MVRMTPAGMIQARYACQKPWPVVGLFAMISMIPTKTAAVPTIIVPARRGRRPLSKAGGSEVAGACSSARTIPQRTEVCLIRYREKSQLSATPRPSTPCGEAADLGLLSPGRPQPVKSAACESARLPDGHHRHRPDSPARTRERRLHYVSPRGSAADRARRAVGS